MPQAPHDLFHTITIDDQIAEIEREQRMREKVYSKWVREGRLNQDVVNRRTATLNKVIDTLKKWKAYNTENKTHSGVHTE